MARRNRWDGQDSLGRGCQMPIPRRCHGSNRVKLRPVACASFSVRLERTAAARTFLRIELTVARSGNRTEATLGGARAGGVRETAPRRALRETALTRRPDFEYDTNNVSIVNYLVGTLYLTGKCGMSKKWNSENLRGF